MRALHVPVSKLLRHSPHGRHIASMGRSQLFHTKFHPNTDL